jgi:hypothetical protein
VIELGYIKPFEKEKLVVGIMYTGDDYFRIALDRICAQYGKIDSQSEEYTFSTFSNYYDGEMRGTVMKRFVSLEKLVDPSSLSEIKIHTNKIEEENSENESRNINLDPCLLGHGKFVMATTKNASFRIPLSKGIYADLSLVYAGNRWVNFFWTYSDVKSEMIKDYLGHVRKIYLEQRKKTT